MQDKMIIESNARFSLFRGKLKERGYNLSPVEDHGDGLVTCVIEEESGNAPPRHRGVIIQDRGVEGIKIFVEASADMEDLADIITGKKPTSEGVE